ncbi:MAG: hypothetical protein UR53_C0001G0028 [Candidatus Magasanikbacteria bacterium GW2011_GWC2_34_16]|uniref:Uncharacterized protein n=1 Tax=Candidatus Magasanikbacteria bacterium GW2011_GWC2_34_16 TaxID=1619045 RepID=A0A0G0ARA4_9BACT|nr:MAG: hypothetical protein UR53_C0001G0028 [Candidatus Magasanikbacteria bacterium GW2011_GWC2_34_16]
MRKLLVVFGLLALFAVVWQFSRTAEPMHDESEALATASRLECGQQIGRDFFQKQSEVFWQGLRLIVRNAVSDADALAQARVIACAILFLTLLGVWAISYLLVERKWLAWLSLVVLVASPLTMNEIMMVRDDAPMTTCLVWGVYFFIRYLKEEKALNLYVAALLFSSATVLLLKAVPYVLVQAAVVLFLLLIKKRLRHLAPAVICAIIPAGVFVGWMWATERLSMFYFSNIVFNGEMYQLNPSQIHGGEHLFRWWIFTLWRDEPAAMIAVVLGYLSSLWVILRGQNRTLPILGVGLAGVTVLMWNKIPQPSYYLQLQLGGIAAFPIFFDRLVHRLEERWPKTKQNLAIAGLTVVLVTFSVNVNNSLEKSRLTPSVERQFENKVRLGGQLYPILTACNSTRLLHGWEVRQRILFTFCALHEQNRIPPVIDWWYSEEYLPSCQITASPPLAVL